ncbi:rRNA maturation RNase YbeY [Commensalibacter oyaizuii]|uniref:Endoribonuclease YbeY n=1 Tax=Commensalibacter oyaizuii TaxID=3043873 RepID=A0ABT6PYB6_9PROT|nr:rRNA maturation RNase YbeY [Commensalibacter sp. TBRC 16381]MDI2089850.1 rRNA maturation RNase YbeY [Commensalibacter sp. TBRC 16381]
MACYNIPAKADKTYRFQIRYDLTYKIIIQDKGWGKILPTLSQLLFRIHQIIPISDDTTLCFDNDHQVKKLNGQFRGKYKPTNVLTFEMPGGIVNGGDIIFALQTIEKEAKQNCRPLPHHLAHLIIHGLLHLQGYDHLYVNDAKEMEMKEAQLLHKLGIPNPWKHNSVRSI